MRLFLMALAVGVIVTLTGTGTGFAAEGNSNQIFWKACAMGITATCPILVMDAAGGEPQAQYELAMLLLYLDKGERSTQTATLLLYESALKGYSPAVTLWNRGARAPIEQDRTPFDLAPDERAHVAEFLIAQRE